LVDSELKYNTTGMAEKMILDLHEKTVVPAETIARAIAYAMNACLSLLPIPFKGGRT